MTSEGMAIGVAVRLADLVELTKPRITVMVGITAAAGFVLASGARLDLALLAVTVLGTALLAAGAAALNQILERDLDRLMARTARRPLPAARLEPETALLFASLLVLSGLVLLGLAVNGLTAAIGAATVFGYAFVYTPLKKVSSLSTLVGALPGAAPPLMGWAGASGELAGGAWVLFALLFLWQLPHFLAVAWLYRDDYARAGLPMLSVLDPGGERVGRQALAYGAALLPVSLMPSALGLAGATYFCGALALGLVFVAVAAAFAAGPTTSTARRLLITSVLYLPAVFAVLVLDRLVS